MNYSNKHIFIISDRDIFFNLYADALVQKCNIDPGRIIAIVYKSGLKESLLRHHNFQYINYENDLFKKINDVSTITTISLNSTIAPIVKEIFEESPDLRKKLSVLITDDEIDLWMRNFKKRKYISINKKQGITLDLLFCLENISNFIGPKIFFHEILCQVLQRENFNFIDANYIFDILPSIQSEVLRKLNSDIVSDNSTRILLGSKGFPIFGVFRFIWIHYKFLDNKQVLFFPVHRYRRVVIDFYLILLNLFFRKNVDFVYLGKTNQVTYNSIIASCSYFVVQDRGGYSSARLYAKWGCGQMIIKRGSFNYLYFQRSFGIDCPSWESFNSLTGLKGDGCRSKDILEISAKIHIEELRSIKSLGQFYR
jgi:hypothetical protein